jgi:hypothetical protein
LKSGCRIEQRQLGQADRIEACLAIDLVVAWRIYYLTDLPSRFFSATAPLQGLAAFCTNNVGM